MNWLLGAYQELNHLLVGFSMSEILFVSNRYPQHDEPLSLFRPEPTLFLLPRICRESSLSFAESSS